MNSTSNPYSPPVAEESPRQSKVSTEGAVLDFLPIMRRWERLRVVYNVLLIVFTVLITLVFNVASMSDVDFWLSVCIGGIIANICFLIGPAIEAYATRFRIWHQVMALILFAAGLLLTAMLAASCVIGYPGNPIFL